MKDLSNLGEHMAEDHGVVGSNPTLPTLKWNTQHLIKEKAKKRKS